MIHLVTHKSRAREGKEHLLFSFPARGFLWKAQLQAQQGCVFLSWAHPCVPEEIPAIERVQEQHRLHTIRSGSGFSEHSYFFFFF